MSTKVLTVTTRILNLAAHLHAKAVGAHRRALTARIARSQQIRTAAYAHYEASVKAHAAAQIEANAFDQSMSEPIVVETTIKP